MSWLNLNESLNNIKGQLSSLANTVLAEDNSEIAKKSDETTPNAVEKEQKIQSHEFNVDDKWSWSTEESKTDQLKTAETITNLKRRIVELENENRDYITSLDELDQNHQRNNEELVKIKRKLEEELENVTEKYEILNMKCNKLALAENAYKKKINELKSKLEEVSQRNNTEIKPDTSSKCEQLENDKLELTKRVSVLESNNRNLENLLEESNNALESKLSEMSSKYQELETENKALRIAMQSKQDGDKITLNNVIGEYELEIEMLQNKLTSLENRKIDEQSNFEHVMNLEGRKTQIEQSDANEANNDNVNSVAVEGTLDTYKKNLDILKQHFHTYIGNDLELGGKEDLESLHLQYSTLVDKISKVFHSTETECDALKTKIFELNQIKTNLQNEKNLEIERLLQNSEILTQDLYNKSKEIKDLEEECSQLMKNNELLINKLTNSKESGLQTIFETNEDNLAILETELENANEKIQELEKSLSDHDSKQHSINSTEAFEDDFLKESEFKDELKQKIEENKSLKVIINDLKEKLHGTEAERDNGRMIIDKLRLDFETTEYQFAEMNINLETLSEEIEKHKTRIDSLVSENETLKCLRDEVVQTEKELETTKEELHDSRKNSRDLQQAFNELQAKFQVKTEDRTEIQSLKEQLDALVEGKNTIENQYQDALKILETVQNERNDLKNIHVDFSNLVSRLCECLELECPQNDEEFDRYKIEDYASRIIESIENFKVEIDRLLCEAKKAEETSSNVDIEKLQQEVQESLKSRNELIGIVQTKHQENLSYHAEIQRLSEILKQECELNEQLKIRNVSLEQEKISSTDLLKSKDQEIEKLTDRVNFLQEKCDVLAHNLLEEQKKAESGKMSFVEKETALSKKVERLQSHLMEVEEHYTQELLQAEGKIAQLQVKLNEAEQREKDSSTIYTSVSIRANQQNEALHQQIQSLTSRYEEFKKKVMDLEDENNTKSSALLNLQLVLEQFQRDREADIVRETDRIRKQIKQEQDIQKELKDEINNLETQLRESKQGLQAASRLNDQLEISKNQISTFKETVTVLTEKLAKKEDELKAVTSQTDGKVDKSLVKNLIIGFVSSNKNMNKDQFQILKIIATVLDFNEQDHNKVNSNQAQQNNWLKSLITTNTGNDLPSYESLSRAFVNFLEAESKPRIVPSLLPTNPISETSVGHSGSISSSPTPIVLNEIVLPTFSDFPQQRNSSSILKGVLKDTT